MRPAGNIHRLVGSESSPVRCASCRSQDSKRQHPCFRVASVERSTTSVLNSTKRSFQNQMIITMTTYQRHSIAHYDVIPVTVTLKAIFFELELCTGGGSAPWLRFRNISGTLIKTIKQT